MRMRYILAVGSAVLVSACGSKVPSPPAQTDGRSVPISVASPFPARSDYAVITAMLLATAEPFETLTETAFSATPADLAIAIDTADKAARGVRGVLPAATEQQLDKQMDAARDALRSQRRADLALAAVEGFRILVAAVPGQPGIPVDVSLLDYAGFRYDADAQANPTRWDDMTRATAFAHDRWASIRTDPAAAPLATRLEAALAAMDAAVTDRDMPRARLSAKQELDLVDLLETAFKPAARAKP